MAFLEHRNIITLLRIYTDGWNETLYKFDDVTEDSPLFGDENARALQVYENRHNQENQIFEDNVDQNFDDYVNQVLDEVENNLAMEEDVDWGWGSDRGYGSSEE